MLYLNEGDSTGEFGMIELLTLMSRHGFAPIESPELRNAELLSYHNVGGVVTSESSRGALGYERRRRIRFDSYIRKYAADYCEKTQRYPSQD